MTNKITKGMILAAGLGTRLRPLTYKTPKPLIEVGGKRLIEYGIELFKKAGIKDIVINLHHLGDQIEKFLGDGSGCGIKISYSREEEILGTGGGIKRAGPFFEGKPFVVINSDLIADIDLRDVIRFHQEKGVPATLVLRPLKRGEDYTPIRIDNDYIAEFGSGDMMYTGVQIIGPEILDQLKPDTFSNIVTDVYIPILKEGKKIAAYVHNGYWIEVGTLKRLEEVLTSAK